MSVGAPPTPSSTPSPTPSPAAGRVTEVGPPEVVDVRRNLWRLPVAMVAVLALLGLALWATVDQLDRSSSDVGLPRVELPSVTGTDLPTAQAALEKLSFVVDVELEPNEIVPKGTVFGQQPLAGAKVSQGDPVTVLVSDGPVGVTLPEVAGQQVADAQALLARLQVQSQVTQVYDEQVPPGQVLDIDPPAGSRAVVGATVQLRVSQGPAPRIVPPIANRTFDQFLVDLGRSGLAVGSITHTFQPNLAQDIVTATSPAAGASVPRGTPVNLTVAGSEGTTTVPYLVGLRQSTAESLLRNAGLGVQVNVQPAQPGDPTIGFVTAQSLPPQSLAAPAAVVTITVGG